MNRSSVVVKRVVFALVTIFVAISLNFMLFRAVPGDAVSALNCNTCSPKFRDYQRHALGLDRSLLTQYWMYVQGLAGGDMGNSLRSERSVLSEIAKPLKDTIPMVLLGTVLAVGFGILTGVVAAWRRGTAVDRASTWGALTFQAFPPQWLGLMMVLYVAGWAGLPSSGIADPTLGILGDASWWEVAVDRLRHMLLPALTLALVLYGNFTLVARSSMLETLGEDYILTARAKGLSNWMVVWRHAFRNALLPVVTIAAMTFGFVAGGVITIEYVFSYPGIGLLTVQAISQRDWPVLQGVFLVMTVTVIFANLVADLLYAKLDPRVVTT